MCECTRFWRMVDRKGPNDCWEWTGYNLKGQGRFKQDGLKGLILSHRYAWEYLNGPIPKDKLICHNCDNSLCCNPNHLYVGDYTSNMSDRLKRDQDIILTSAKLSRQQVREIRQLMEIPLNTNVILGKMFGVGRHTIGNIRRNKSWVGI